MDRLEEPVGGQVKVALESAPEAPVCRLAKRCGASCKRRGSPGYGSSMSLTSTLEPGERRSD